MQRNMPTRKRKELGQLEQVNHDLSNFSISSPAAKTRRLDAQLPPIWEEAEEEVDDNQERAIVLFNPVNNPIIRNHSSNVSISLSPDLVSGLKDRFTRSSCQYEMKCEKSEEEEDSKKQCTAVVPWVPSRFTPVPPAEVLPLGEPMEDEEMGTAEMEIEESSTPAGGGRSNAINDEGFLQWQQQHCMIPQPPQNASTPITWFP